MAIFLGLRDCDAMMIGDLSFSKGERLLIVDREDESWWYAISLATNQEGYVPIDEISPDESNNTSLASCFFGSITGPEAAKRLLRHGLPNGTFLIRSASQSTKYVLCIRDRQTVKQFKIDQLANERLCIQGGSIFPNMQELIAHYMEDSDGHPCKLVLPCPGDSSPTEEDTEKHGQIRTESFDPKRKVLAGESPNVQAGIWKQSKKQLQLRFSRLKLSIQQKYQKLLKL